MTTLPAGYHAFAIPKIIFDDFGEKYGLGEPFEVILQSSTWMCRKLNPSAPEVGAELAITYRHFHDRVAMVSLYPRVPNPSQSDTVFEVQAFLEIRGMLTDAGVWMATQGTALVDVVTGEIRNRDLSQPGVLVACLMLARAHELVLNSRYGERRKWDATTAERPQSS